MTGFAGLLTPDGSGSNQENVGAMLKAMPHRGTIHKTVAPSAKIALGTCSDHPTISPLYAEHQSFVLLDGDIHADLTKEQANRKESKDSPSDAQWLLTAFRKHRHQLLDNLAGDFAFALWDHDRQELTLARDAFGSRPIFFYKDRHTFAFASEIKGLRRLSWMKTSLNRERIADYLLASLEGINKHCTFYENIYRVPAGSYLTVSGRSYQAHKYWTPSTDTREHLSSNDSIEAFTTTFREAVACRYRAPARTGVLLSGGIDSCSIVGSASEIISTPLNTFSLISGEHDTECEESQSVAIMQARGNLNARNLKPSEVSKIAPPISSFVSKIDNPFTASLLAGPIPLYAMAQEGDLKTILDGVDGDVVTSLTGNHQWFLANEFGIMTGLREMRNEASYYDSHAEFPKAIAAFLFRRLGNRLISRSNPIRSLFRRTQGIRTRETDIADAPIKRAFAKETHVEDRFRQQLENEHPSYPFTIKEACSQTLTAPYIAAALERYEEAAACYGLQASHPFMDRRLVELCLRLPWHHRIHHGEPKWILRQAMKRVLPKEIFSQYKIANIGHWFIQEVFRNYLIQNPKPPSWLLERLEDFIEIDELKQSWKRAIDLPDEEYDDLLSSSIILGEWIRHHF